MTATDQIARVSSAAIRPGSTCDEIEKPADVAGSRAAARRCSVIALTPPGAFLEHDRTELNRYCDLGIPVSRGALEIASGTKAFPCRQSLKAFRSSTRSITSLMTAARALHAHKCSDTEVCIVLYFCRKSGARSSGAGVL